LNASVRGGEFVSFDEQESSNIDQDVLDPGLFQPMIRLEPFMPTLERLAANLPESINKVILIIYLVSKINMNCDRSPRVRSNNF
jgi:hypothetical protein